jgi:WD40 repeat protein
VALKVIRAELAGPSLRRRFELETNILGRLSHPGISRIYEAGADGDTCFFAMELVEGRPLTAHADARGLDPRARLDLLARVCDAVHHAHVKGVIHCDLKPANILVQEDGQPKVLDFGIAKIVDPDTALTGATLNGQIVGTPAYMSPEQTACAAEALDARSDVYTLGAIGYELLSGALPHDPRGLPLPEVVHRIREQDAPSLSTRRPDLRGDVETILAKALAREADARYQSAAALADDLRRHLRDEPIEARAPTAGYQLRMFARRNRGLVAALAGLLAAIVAGAGIAAALAVRAERARAQLAARNDTLAILEARATLREDPTRAAARLKTLSPAASWDDARAVALEAEQLGVARELLRGHDGEVHDVDVDPRGRFVASASYDRTVRIWELGARRARVVKTSAELHDVAYSRDGRLAAAGAAGTLRLVEPDGTSRELAGHTGWVTSVAWSPDGAALASAGEDGTVRLWDGAGGARATLAGHGTEVTRVAWSPDGTLVASADGEGGVRVWPAAGGAPRVLEAHRGEVNDLAFAGAALVTVGVDGRALRWDLATGVAATLSRDDDEHKRVAATRDGRRVAWADRDGEVVLADLVSGARRPLGALRGPARALAFSPAGDIVAAAGDGRTVSVWSVAGGDRLDLLGHAARVRALAFTPDGAALLSAADDGTIRVWPARVPFGAGARVVAADERGARIAVSGPDPAIRVRRLPDGPVLRLAGHTDEIYQLAFSPDGRRLASASRDRSVRVWDVDTGEGRTLALRERVVRVAFGEGRVAAAGSSGALALWDPESGAIVDLAGHRDRVNDVRFSPDGGLLASAGDDHGVRLWQVEGGSGRLLGELPGRAMVVAFSPDGRRLAAAGNDGVVRVFHLGDGREEVHTLHDGVVTALAFSPDGSLLATGGVDRAVRILGAGGAARDAGRHAGAVVSLAFAGGELISTAADGSARAFRAGRDRLLAIGHGPALDAALTADGRLAFVTAEDGLRLVPVAGVGDAGAVRARLDALTTAFLEGDALEASWAEASGAGR